MLEAHEVQRALVITAHPDDVDFGAAGSVANMTDAGIEVTYCLVTDGDAGGSDQSISRNQMAQIRREEQTRAAKEVGVAELIFLGFGDGRVEYNLSLRAALTKVIRTVRPQRVLAQSPQLDLTRIYAGHPDHVATGQATMAAVYPDARNPFAHPELLAEGFEPWAVPEVWVMAFTKNASTVVHVEDVTANVDRKIRALMRHETQHADPTSTEARIRAWMQTIATQHGLPEGHSAEAFQVVDTK